MPINPPVFQTQEQLKTKFLEEWNKKKDHLCSLYNDDPKKLEIGQKALDNMMGIPFYTSTQTKELSKLKEKDLNKIIDGLSLLKHLKNGSQTAKDFNLFNSINDHCSAIVNAILDNRLEQKGKESPFEAFRSKLARGFGSPQEREIKGSYAIIIHDRLGSIKANLSELTEEAQKLIGQVAAKTLGGSGGNNQGPQSFTEKVNKVVEDASNQAKKDKEAETKLPPTPPPLGRNTQGGGYESDSGSGYTSDDFKTTKTTSSKITHSDDLPDDLFSNDQVDDLEAGMSPSPSPRNPTPQKKFSTTRLPTLFLSPEGGAATRVPSYQPLISKEPESTLVVPTKKGVQTPPPHTQTTVKAGIQFFSQGGGAKASTKLDALVARRKELLKARAVAITAKALRAMPGEFAKGVEAGRKKLAESPNNPNNRKTGR